MHLVGKSFVALSLIIGLVVVPNGLASVEGNYVSPLNAASWTIETAYKWPKDVTEGYATSFALDSNNIPHIVYSLGPDNKPGIQYLTKQAKKWTVAWVYRDTLPSGSIALDSHDQPVIVCGGRGLKYCTKNGSDFTVTVIAVPVPFVHKCKIVISKTDDPYIVFSFAKRLYTYTTDRPEDRGLGFADFIDGQWKAEIIPGAYGCVSFDITLDRDEMPLITYVGRSKESLTCTRRLSNGDWKSEVIKAECGGNITMCKAFVNSSGDAMILYSSRNDGSIWMALGRDSKWTQKQIITQGYVNSYDAAMDSTGSIYAICTTFPGERFPGNSNEHLVLWKRTGEKWDSNEILNNSHTALNPMVAVATNGKAQVVYTDVDSYIIYYANENGVDK